jgi:hypothetical protein
VRITFTAKHSPYIKTYNPKYQLQPPKPTSVKMQFSITAVLFGLIAVSSAAIADVEGVYNVARSDIETRQAANGACCIPNRSLKQDACTVNGAAGKCVPGGPAQCKYNPLCRASMDEVTAMLTYTSRRWRTELRCKQPIDLRQQRP